MKKLFLTLVLLLFVNLSVNADIANPRVKWTCIDKTGKTVVCPKHQPNEAPEILTRYEEKVISSQKCINKYNDKINEALKKGKKDVSELKNKRENCKDKSLSGFKNKDGKIVIKAKFDPWGYPYFEDKILPVSQNGKWGVIDRKGNWVVKPQFDLLLKYSDGLAGACSDGMCGYINEKGKWVIQPQDIRFMCYTLSDNSGWWHNYKCKTGSSDFSEGLAAVKYGREYYADIPSALFKFDKFPVVFPDGMKKEAGTYFGELKDGIFYVRNDLTNDELEALYNKYGEFDEVYNKTVYARKLEDKLKEKCDELRKEKYIRARVYYGYNSGYIDKTGNLIIKDLNGSLGAFSEGLAAVKLKGGLYGYINKNGEVIITPKYHEAGQFKDGVASVEVDKTQEELNFDYKNQINLYIKWAEERLKRAPKEEKAKIKEENKKNLEHTKEYLEKEYNIKSDDNLVFNYAYADVVNPAHADEIYYPTEKRIPSKDLTMLIFSLVLIVLIAIAGVSIKRSIRNKDEHKNN